MLFIKYPGRALLLLGDVENGRGIGRRKLLSEKLGLPLSGLEVGWGWLCPELTSQTNGTDPSPPP